MDHYLHINNCNYKSYHQDVKKKMQTNKQIKKNLA